MSKIRLIEGYHDRKNIQYYRDDDFETVTEIEVIE